MRRRKKDVDDQAEDGGKAMINAVNEDFGVHRRFEVVDEERGEDFTAGNAADKEEQVELRCWRRSRRSGRRRRNR